MGFYSPQLSGVDAATNNGDGGLAEQQAHAGNHVSDLHLDAVLGNDGFCACNVSGHVNLNQAASGAFVVHGVGVKGDDVAGHGGRESSLDLLDQVALERGEGNNQLSVANDEADFLNAIRLQGLDQGEGQVQLAQLESAVVGSLGLDANMLAVLFELGSVGHLVVVQIGDDVAIGIQGNVGNHGCGLGSELIGVVGAEVLAAAQAGVLGVATGSFGGLHNALVPVMAERSRRSVSFLGDHAANGAVIFADFGINAGGLEQQAGSPLVTQSSAFGFAANLAGLGEGAGSCGEIMLAKLAVVPGIDGGVAHGAILAHLVTVQAVCLLGSLDSVGVVQGSALSPGLVHGAAHGAGFGVGLGVGAGCFLHGNCPVVAVGGAISLGVAVAAAGTLEGELGGSGAGCSLHLSTLDIVVTLGRAFSLGVGIAAAGALESVLGGSGAGCFGLQRLFIVVTQSGAGSPGIVDVATDGALFTLHSTRGAGRSRNSFNLETVLATLCHCKAEHHQKHSDEDDQAFLHCVPPKNCHSEKGGRYAAHPVDRKLRSARISIMLLQCRLCYCNIGIVDVAVAISGGNGIEAIYQLASDGDGVVRAQQSNALAQQLSSLAEHCGALQGSSLNGDFLVAFLPLLAVLALDASGVAGLGGSCVLSRNINPLVALSSDLFMAAYILLALSAIYASGVASLGAGCILGSNFLSLMSGNHAALLNDGAANGALDVTQFASLGAGGILGSIHNQTLMGAGNNLFAVNDLDGGAALETGEGISSPHDIQFATNSANLVDNVIFHNQVGPGVGRCVLHHATGVVAQFALQINIAGIATIDGLTIGVSNSILMASLLVIIVGFILLDFLVAALATIQVITLLDAGTDNGLNELFLVTLGNFIARIGSIRDVDHSGLGGAALADALHFIVSGLLAGCCYINLITEDVTQRLGTSLDAAILVGTYGAIGDHCFKIFAACRALLSYEGMGSHRDLDFASLATYGASLNGSAFVGAGRLELNGGHLIVMLNRDQTDRLRKIAVLALLDCQTSGVGLAVHFLEHSDVLVYVVRGVEIDELSLGVLAAFAGALVDIVARGAAGSLYAEIVNLLQSGARSVMSLVAVCRENFFAQSLAAAIAVLGLAAINIAGSLNGDFNFVMTQSRLILLQNLYIAAVFTNLSQTASGGAGCFNQLRCAILVVASSDHRNNVRNRLVIESVGASQVLHSALFCSLLVLSAANEAFPNDIASNRALTGLNNLAAEAAVAGLGQYEIVSLLADRLHGTAGHAQTDSLAILRAGGLFDDFVMLIVEGVMCLHGGGILLLYAASSAAVVALTGSGAGSGSADPFNDIPVCMLLVIGDVFDLGAFGNNLHIAADRALGLNGLGRYAVGLGGLYMHIIMSSGDNFNSVVPYRVPVAVLAGTGILQTIGGAGCLQDDLFANERSRVIGMIIISRNPLAAVVQAFELHCIAARADHLSAIGEVAQLDIFSYLIVMIESCSCMLASDRSLGAFLDCAAVLAHLDILCRLGAGGIHVNLYIFASAKVISFDILAILALAAARADHPAFALLRAGSFLGGLTIEDPLVAAFNSNGNVLAVNLVGDTANLTYLSCRTGLLAGGLDHDFADYPLMLGAAGLAMIAGSGEILGLVIAAAIFANGLPIAVGLAGGSYIFPDDVFVFSSFILPIAISILAVTDELLIVIGSIALGEVIAVGVTQSGDHGLLRLTAGGALQNYQTLFGAGSFLLLVNNPIFLCRMAGGAQSSLLVAMLGCSAALVLADIEVIALCRAGGSYSLAEYVFMSILSRLLNLCILAIPCATDNILAICILAGHVAANSDAVNIRRANGAGRRSVGLIGFVIAIYQNLGIVVVTQSLGFLVLLLAAQGADIVLSTLFGAGCFLALSAILNDADLYPLMGSSLLQSDVALVAAGALDVSLAIVLAVSLSDHLVLGDVLMLFDGDGLAAFKNLAAEGALLAGLLARSEGAVCIALGIYGKDQLSGAMGASVGNATGGALTIYIGVLGAGAVVGMSTNSTSLDTAESGMIVRNCSTVGFSALHPILGHVRSVVVTILADVGMIAVNIICAQFRVRMGAGHGTFAAFASSILTANKGVILTSGAMNPTLAHIALCCISTFKGRPRISVRRMLTQRFRTESTIRAVHICKCRHAGQNHAQNQNESKNFLHCLQFILSYKSLSF